MLVQASIPNGLAAAVMWDLGANVWLLGGDTLDFAFSSGSSSARFPVRAKGILILTWLFDLELASITRRFLGAA